MRELQIRHATLFFAYLLIVWGFYRLLFQFPDPIDETIVKPIIWLVPLFIFLKKENLGLDSLGITFKNLFPSIYFSLALGALFAFEGFAINYFKYSGSNFGANIGSINVYSAIIISFITAFSEEIAFRGYFFNRLWQSWGSEWKANLLASLLWMLLHAPQAFFDWRLSMQSLAGYLFLVFIFGLGTSFIFARTKNIIAAIILHVMWAWPIMLFR